MLRKAPLYSDFGIQSVSISMSSAFVCNVLLCLGILGAVAGAVRSNTIALWMGLGVIALYVLLKRAFLVEEAAKWRLEAEFERKDSELAVLKEANSALADGLQVALFLLDEKGQVLQANKKAIELFNISDAQSKTILAVTLSYDLERFVLECAESREASSMEVVLTYPSDAVAICNAWPGPGNGVYLSILEITDLRRLERVRQDFVANVSHELRTPLTSIRLMAETLLDEGDSIGETQGKTYLKRIMSEVDRLSALAGDLLVLSSSELNPVRKSACDLALVTRNVVSELAPKAKEKGLELTVEGPKTLMVPANSNQITQVLINLIDNAIAYTSEGKVEVSFGANEASAYVEVKDTGIGIAAEHLSRIFERFYRVDKGRSRASGGTGLGLSIVKHIVEGHGGSVSVESDLNQGSRFVVTLPIDEVEEG